MTPSRVRNAFTMILGILSSSTRTRRTTHARIDRLGTERMAEYQAPRGHPGQVDGDLAWAGHEHRGELPPRTDTEPPLEDVAQVGAHGVRRKLKLRRQLLGAKPAQGTEHHLALAGVRSKPGESCMPSDSRPGSMRTTSRTLPSV